MPVHKIPRTSYAASSRTMMIDYARQYRYFVAQRKQLLGTPIQSGLEWRSLLEWEANERETYAVHPSPCSDARCQRCG